MIAKYNEGGWCLKIKGNAFLDNNEDQCVKPLKIFYVGQFQA